MADPVVESVELTVELNEKLADFLTLCAQHLRSGTSPYKVANYLQEQARNLRESNQRVTVALKTPEKPVHEIQVRPEDLDTSPPASGFRAHCSCGWSGNWRLHGLFAQEEANGHLAEER